jgi:precorrin-6A/cobalt-precorrin-6A reductase
MKARIAFTVDRLKQHIHRSLAIKLLILGGTGEAIKLANQASQIEQLTVISSLAGRTQQPILPMGEIRQGGFGGVLGLVDYLRSAAIDFLIDATHPFASQISWNAAQAAAICNIPHLLLERPAWEVMPGDRWLPAASNEVAANLLVNNFQRVFLTIGRQELAGYARLADIWFLMRSIDPPPLDQPLPPGQLLLAKGPFDVAAERRLLQEYQLQVIVSKNSGGAATYAKIVAARELGIPVMMIERPAMPEGDRATNVAGAISWLQCQRGSKI